MKFNMQNLQEGDWAGVTRFLNLPNEVLIDTYRAECASFWTAFLKESFQIWMKPSTTKQAKRYKKIPSYSPPQTRSVENYLERRPQAIDPGWRRSRHRWTPLSSVQNVPVVSLNVNPPFKSRGKRVCPRVIGDVISRVSYLQEIRLSDADGII